MYMELIAHPHLVPNLRMYGAIPPLLMLRNVMALNYLSTGENLPEVTSDAIIFIPITESLLIVTNAEPQIQHPQFKSFL